MPKLQGGRGKGPETSQPQAGVSLPATRTSEGQKLALFVYELALICEGFASENGPDARRIDLRMLRFNIRKAYGLAVDEVALAWENDDGETPIE